MPYYKKNFYIEETINSIINQSYQKFEIILIDDELSMESGEVLKKIKEKDERIKIIKNKNNLGAGESRNVGIKLAQGEYIAFCDCDDLWKRDKLKDQLIFMKNLDIDFSFTSYEVIIENGKMIGHRDAAYSLTFEKLLSSCDIGLSTVICKKKLFDNKNYFFPKIKTKEDFVVWLKLLKDLSKQRVLMSLTIWRKLFN